MGDVAVGDTNRGKKAKKKVDSFKFNMLVNSPLMAICHLLLFGSGQGLTPF
jgi:hypothetical protein